MSRPETSANHTVYTQSLPLERYTVGWICALPCELTAARAMLDHRHVRPKNQSKHDENNYTLGSIAGHNIAIVCLPEYGTNKAAIAAKSMQATFPNIRFGLLVGVGGGVPGPITETGPANDIRLGDVVVSLPAGQGGGVIQYDLIRREVDGFRRVGLLNKPPTLLRTAVASLRAERRLGRQLTGLIEDAFAPDDECCEDKCDDDEESEGERWTYPSTGRDFLFSPGYKHRSSGADDCTKCMEAKSAGDIITRRPRKTTHPKIHYGNIGSGNSLIKNGLERDKLAQRDSIICFEMEAAGLMDDFPCLVIRGISDYADSHKNSSWQPYAAAAAAAYAKQLVCSITPQDIDSLAPIQALQLLLSGNRMYKADDTPTCPSVQAVLRKLCNFPLAIVQANAYINNRRLSMDDFLQQYEQQFIRPMSQKPRGPWNYDQVVNTTWEVSLTVSSSWLLIA
ncbi:unnamed protein product [Aspergillus oryzae RIB40]|uniref:DNA, SC166 n=1 Tax=Aspergillus oryzae (strain ATCC 42149 / RIB 40) TaxID=510516 RepID=Q2U9P2_ASPOR|nr:unnamed protein product [Aspergillus oryzae RIB40]BAE61723.1 unnamed protein product [Aspergillus oryzae RIB40]